jgi:uncharacterized protein (TIRG00374 family)
VPDEKIKDDGMRKGLVIKRVAYGVIGLTLGAVFLYLALRNIDAQEIKAVIQRLERSWLIFGVAIYMASIAVRCVRWGLLLRTNGLVKWRHVTEALLAGFAANYLLPARIGELFRADYAMRLFHMSRFTSLGTIFVERVFDGMILVCGLWISLGILSLSASTMPLPHWAIAVGVAASVLFGLALIFAVFSRRIDLRKFGLSPFFADRWDKMRDGISSVTRGQTGTVVLCSLGIWILEAIALGSVVRAFGTTLTMPQTVTLVGLGSLSTLVPTAPGFLGTYQFVFGQVFLLFGHSESTGVVVATAVQLFFFGSVTILGIFVLLSRSGISVLRAMRLETGDSGRR